METSQSRRVSIWPRWVICFVRLSVCVFVCGSWPCFLFPHCSYSILCVNVSMVESILAFVSFVAKRRLPSLDALTPLLPPPVTDGYTHWLAVVTRVSSSTLRLSGWPLGRTPDAQALCPPNFHWPVSASQIVYLLFSSISSSSRLKIVSRFSIDSNNAK